MKQASMETALPVTAPVRPIDTSLVVPNGPVRRLYRWVQPAVEGWFGLPQLWRIYDTVRIPGIDADHFAERALSAIGVTTEVTEADEHTLKAIHGPLVVCAIDEFSECMIPDEPLRAGPDAERVNRRACIALVSGSRCRV